MEGQKVVRKVFLELLSGYEGDLDDEIVPALLEAARSEARRLEAHERNERIALRDAEVNEILEFAERLDELKEDDEAFAEIRVEFCVSLLNRIDMEQRKRIFAQYAPRPQMDLSASGSTYANQRRRKPIPKVKRQRDSSKVWPHTWTQERINEWDSDVKRGISGVSGLKFRVRDGSVDRGNYAGRVHLASTAGHNPIAVHGGVEHLLREISIYEKYKKDLPTTTDVFLFDQEDHFRVEWERLPDGTRSFVKMVSSMRR